MDQLVLEAIARLKRAQPRNADTVLVCKALEAVLYRQEAKVTECPLCAKPRKAKAAAMRRWRGRKHK